MSDYWGSTPEQRAAIDAHREAAGISYDLSAALEYNPDDNRNEDDIAQVLAEFDGERDEENWVWLVEFNDGERGLFIGGCDYTGWDCQSSLQLLPFDGWETRVREKWSKYSRTPVDTVVATLNAGLAARAASLEKEETP